MSVTITEVTFKLGRYYEISAKGTVMTSPDHCWTWFCTKRQGGALIFVGNAFGPDIATAVERKLAEHLGKSMPAVVAELLKDVA